MSAFEGYQRSKPLENTSGLDASRMSFNEGLSGGEIVAYSALALLAFYVAWFIFFTRMRPLINRASSKMPTSNIGEDIQLKEDT